MNIDINKFNKEYTAETPFQCKRGYMFSINYNKVCRMCRSDKSFQFYDFILHSNNHLL